MTKKESRGISIPRVQLSQQTIQSNDENLESHIDEYLASANEPKKHSPYIDEFILRDLGYKVKELFLKRDFSYYKTLVSKEGVDVLAKITEKSQVPAEYLKSTILNEIGIIKGMRHRNILEYICGIESNFKVYLLFKKPGNGTLDDYLGEHVYAREPLCHRFMMGLVRALDFLHNDQRMVHRQLAPWNVYLDDNFNPRLGNFELALVVPAGSEIKTVSGISHYLAPEVRTGESHDPYPADVWALGALFYELLLGRPFSHETSTRSSFSDHTGLSLPMRRSLKLMTQSSPSKRPKVRALYQHEWFKMAEDVMTSLSVKFRQSNAKTKIKNRQSLS